MDETRTALAVVTIVMFLGLIFVGILAIGAYGGSDTSGLENDITRLENHIIDLEQEDTLMQETIDEHQRLLTINTKLWQTQVEYNEVNTEMWELMLEYLGL